MEARQQGGSAADKAAESRPETYQERVARTVQAAVTESGVTVVWLVGRTGIPMTTMHRRLKGLAPFTVAELDAIAAALRVPVESLVPAGAAA